MLKNLLSKLTGKAKATDNATRTNEQQVSRIIVSASAFAALDKDPWKLVQAVVDYVNFMLEQARFTRDELPAAAIQLYHTDYYLAQVNNGGHAQFVGNAGQNLSFILDDVDQGLLHAQAAQHHSIFNQMAFWVRANVKEATQQTGFEGGIAPELAALDRPFFEVDKDVPLTVRLAHWVAQLPSLKVVPDDQVRNVMTQQIALNPYIKKRQTQGMIAHLNHQLTNKMMLGFGMAGARCQPLAPVIKVAGGSVMKTPQGEKTCWLIMTGAGKKYGTVSDDLVQIYDYVPGSEDKLPTDIAKITMDDIRDFIPPQVGELQSTVTSEEIDETAQFCLTLNAGPAIDLLIRKYASEVSIDFASVRSAGPNRKGRIGASIFVIVNNARAAFTVLVQLDGAILLAEPSHDVLQKVSKAEIETHRREYMVQDA